MAFVVRLSPRAESELEEAHGWATQHAPATAAAWLQRFKVALLTLAENPERCQLAAEDKQLRCGLRQFLYGKKPNVFRVLFVLADPDVRIVAIRRASRRSISRRDLDL